MMEEQEPCEVEEEEVEDLASGGPARPDPPRPQVSRDRTI